jgi:hypothetical protein
MKRYLFSLILSLQLVNLRAQTVNYVLPKVENGQWYIALGQTKVKLPTSYNYVHYFDNTGHAYFCNGSKYGIIDSTGKEKLAAKQHEIVQYSNGLFRYAVEKGYLLHSLKTNSKTPCSWSKQIAENWIYFKQEGNSFILHTSWKEPLAILSEKSIEKIAFNYVYVCKYDLRFSLYLPDGKLLEENPEIVREEYDALYVKGAKNHFILNTNGKIQLPLAATNVRLQPDYFTYCFKEKVHLTDSETNTEIFVADGDGIAPFKRKFYVYKNNRVGLVDANGKQILAPIYRNFYELQGNYVVNQNGNVGLVNEVGDELIPTIYQSITQQGEYYLTTLFTGTKGLISAVNYKELLSPYYTKITTDGTSIRAWDNTRLVIIELEKDHREKNRLYLNNVISMNTYKDITKLRFLDPRLFKIGWFYTSKTTTNETNKTHTTNYLWGIEQNDSVRIKARFRTPTYVENALFSLVPSKKLADKIESKLLGTIEIGNNKFGSDAFNFMQLKKANKNLIFAMDSTDFYTKDFARIHTTKSLGIISKSGATKELLFIDDAFNGYSRFCQSGEIEKNKDKKGNVQIPSFLVSTGYISNQNATVKITKGPWNYLRNNGDSVFNEPFLYASNFYKKTAIVQRKKGYGVIREDSVIIPTVFSSIKRIGCAKDTLFLVNRSRYFVNYLDSNLQILDLTGIKILATSDSLIVIQKGSNYQLLSSANQILETSPRMYYLINKHYVMHKEGKNYVIRNSKLTVVGKSVLKPLIFIDDTHFLVENHHRNAVFNLRGDTVIGFEYKNLEYSNGFIRAYGEDDYIRIYNKNFQAIVRKRHHNTIDIKDDFSQQHIAITVHQKAYIYDQSGIQVAKIVLQKEEELLHIYFNLVLTTLGRFLNFQGQCVNLKSLESGHNSIDSNYYVFVDKLDKWHILTTSGDLLLEEEKKTDLNYLGEDVFCYYDTTDQFVIFDSRNKQKYLYAESFKGKFSDGYLLLKIEGNYEFVDRNFQNIFQKSFDDAYPFQHGMAPVMIDKNWTLIGKQGFQKALPTYNYIEKKGVNLYSIETHNYYGIYDSHGKVIIEPSYLNIHFLDYGILQATKLGVIDYYTMDGRKLE